MPAPAERIGDTLFTGTLGARLVVPDAKTGNVLWSTQIAGRGQQGVIGARRRVADAVSPTP
jgi:hypothetical protein